MLHRIAQTIGAGEVEMNDQRHEPQERGVDDEIDFPAT